MHLRRLAVVLAVPAVLTATACTSDSGSKSGPNTSSPTPANVTALVSKIRAAVKPVRTAHFELGARISGRKLTGTGDEKLDGGTLTALTADATIPGGVGSISIVVVDGKRYAKLPPPFASRQKPWTPITSGAKNAVVAQLSDVLDAAIAASSLESLSDVVGAATALRKVGTSGSTTHYTLTVDPTRIADSGGARKALGRKAIPVQLYLDGSGRPAKVQVKVNLLGQPTDTTVTFSKFDAPVTISPPPSGQVSAG